jgi:hypothetical protein
MRTRAPRHAGAGRTPRGARAQARAARALKRERADNTLLEILYPLPFVVLVVRGRGPVPRASSPWAARCTIDQSDSSLTAVSRTSGVPGDISVTSFRRDARALGRVLGERRRGEVWLLFNTLVNKANNLSTAIQYSTGY